MGRAVIYSYLGNKESAAAEVAKAQELKKAEKKGP